MSSDMPSVITSTVEHFGLPENVVFTACDAYIHTIFWKRAFRSAQDDVWRAMEALAAIPGRFDRLLTCAQLSHTRSTRGSTARTIQWARTTVGGERSWSREMDFNTLAYSSVFGRRLSNLDISTRKVSFSAPRRPPVLILGSLSS